MFTKFDRNQIIHGWDVEIKLFSKWRPSAILNLQNFDFTGCAVAQHCYNDDVSFLWEKWKFWPLVNSKPLNRLTYNLSGLIVSKSPTFFSKFGNNPLTGDFWAKGWNIPFLCDFYFLFSDQRREEIPERILTHNGSKDVESRKDVPIWGYKMKNWNLTPYFPKNPK